MTIHYPDRFKAAKPAGFDGVFEWDFLIPAFQTVNPLITPMDFDCVVERKGHFLIFETKDFNVPIDRGQIISLESITHPKDCTVIVLRGKTAVEIYGWEVWRFNPKGHVYKKWFDGTSTDLVKFCETWINWANR